MEEVANQSKKILIEELYKSTFKIFIDNIVICIANTFILLFCSVLFAITVIGILAIPALFGGYLNSMIKIASGDKDNIGDFIKDGLNHFGSLLGSKIFYTVCIFIGFLLFVVPGIYLMVKWFFVTQIIVNENKSISDAYSKSSQLTDGIFWNIFVIIIINAIIGAIATPLLLFTMPFATLVCAKCYVELLK